MCEFRRLAPQDIPRIQQVFESQAVYTKNVFGRSVNADDGERALAAEPPDATRGAKMMYGLFDGDRMLGLIDFVLHYPTRDTVHIGLLMVDKSVEGQGYGRRLHNELLAMLRNRPEITTLHLYIVDTNSDTALPFWRKFSYLPTGESLPWRQNFVSCYARGYAAVIR